MSANSSLNEYLEQIDSAIVQSLNTNGFIPDRLVQLKGQLKEALFTQSSGTNLSNYELLAQAIVDEMIARGVGIGGGGDSYESITSSIGLPNSPITDEVQYFNSEDFSTTYLPWNINSLLKGIFAQSKGIANIQQFVNDLVVILNNVYNKVSSPITTLPTIVQTIDVSGTIVTANESIVIYNYTNAPSQYLFIQNHNLTPSGDLWFNFDTPASIGSGSICLKPGDNFTMESSIITREMLNILGTTVGMQYTIKKA